MQGRRDLPPLDLLRGFEAAARLLSFTRAAEELFVTQSAMSRQVKALEDALGVQLFHRRHRELLLTEAGQSLYKTVTEILRTLREATARLAARPVADTLTVSSTLSFASLWLIPRLADFQRAHPGIDVRLAANNDIQDLERDRIDVAIRYSPRAKAGPGAMRLFGERVLPVASPRLVPESLSKSADLARFTLLHYDDADNRYPWLSWDVWLETMRLPRLQPAGVLRFSHYEQAIQAAIEGDGIALGRMPLVERLIRDGRLVAPLAPRFAHDTVRAFWAIVGKHAAGRAEALAFVTWLRAQAGRMP